MTYRQSSTAPCSMKVVPAATGSSSAVAATAASVRPGTPANRSTRCSRATRSTTSAGSRAGGGPPIPRGYGRKCCVSRLESDRQSRQGGFPMALARVVTFDGVNADRMTEMQSEMEGGERPAEIPAKEIVVLHDPEAEKSLVILFFENEDDYRQG